jgi:hypothetical protein
MKAGQEAAIKGGFKYNLEHIRSVERMQAMGLSIDGHERKMYNGVDSVVLSTEDVTNLIPTEGLNYVLGAALTGVSPISSWYIALFEGDYTPVAGVTAASFPGAATECTAYDESTRQAWTPGAVAAGSVNNSASKAVFTMNATKTVYGLAQTSQSAKSSTSGTLVSVARFASAKSVVDDDILNVTSTLTMTSS